MTGVLIAMSITLVAIIALLTAYLLGVMGGFREDSPVRVEPDTVHVTIEPVPTS